MPLLESKVTSYKNESQQLLVASLLARIERLEAQLEDAEAKADARDERITRLEADLRAAENERVKLRGKIERQAAEIRRQDAYIERLRDQKAKLKADADEDSHNSPKPPSSDVGKARLSRAERRRKAREEAKRRSQERGQRKAGKQPEQDGHGRKHLPSDLFELIDLYPELCSCGHQFTSAEREHSLRHGVHQRFELPEQPLDFFEFHTHQLRCPGCRARVTASLPAEYQRQVLGPRLRAAIVSLAIRNRVSRRQLQELAQDLFGIGISVGMVEAILKDAALALAAPHVKLVEHVQAAPAANIDETGWLTDGELRCLLVSACEDAAFFKVVQSRWTEFLDELLSEHNPGQVVMSDRWFIYDALDIEKRQVCWEHLKRAFIKHSEGLIEQKQFGTDALTLTRAMFHAWHAFCEHGDRARLQDEMAPIQTGLHELLSNAARKSKRTRLYRRIACDLLKLWPALWTFLKVDGVEPTNNAAERALRGPVIARRLSHGTRNEAGEAFVERAMSANITCRLQGRSLYQYFAELLTAWARGDPLPALV